MKTLVPMFCCLAVSCAALSIMEEWSNFKKQFGKNYENKTEENNRFLIFIDNFKLIEEHNSKHAAGQVPYSMKLNYFGDMLPEEVMVKTNGFNSSIQIHNKPYRLGFVPQPNVALPPIVDWRVSGAVTPVKNQGECMSCWAFSTTGALEGQVFRKTGRLVSLSEQQLVDCSVTYGNYGCQGGIMNLAYDYVRDNGGLSAEQVYPYRGQSGQCMLGAVYGAVAGSAIHGHVELPNDNEEALKVAVATVGPISVAVSAENRGFLYYGGGIFNGDGCLNKNPDHGVLVVGYGTEGGLDYWIVKNSWGTIWGEQGYMKLAMGSNLCGITSAASYPIM